MIHNKKILVASFLKMEVDSEGSRNSDNVD